MERGSRMKWVGEKTNIGKHRGKNDPKMKVTKLGGDRPGYQSTIS